MARATIVRKDKRRRDYVFTPSHRAQWRRLLRVWKIRGYDQTKTRQKCQCDRCNWLRVNTWAIISLACLLGAVNEVVAVLKGALNGESGTVAGLGPASVIGTSVTALGLHIGDAQVFVHKLLDKLGHAGVVFSSPNEW